MDVTFRCLLGVVAGGMVLGGVAHAAVSQPDLRCQDCVAGPYEITRAPGPPSSDSIAFPSFAGPGYALVVREWDIGGAGMRIELNGVPLVDRRGAGAGSVPAGIPVSLMNDNILTVTLRGSGGRVVVDVRATESAELPGCGPAEATQFFTAPLTPVEDLVAWEPLGGLDPPAHTLPTHHSYPNPPRVPGATTAYPIMAPGRVRLVAAEYLPDDDDFSLHLRPCDEVRMYLLHVKRLGARLQRLLGDPALWSPVPALTTSIPFSAALTSIDFAPGELLGVTGTGTSTSYDVGLVDHRQPVLAFVNPTRYALPGPEVVPELDPALVLKVIRETAPHRLQQFCALDYFEPTLAAQYRALLGTLDGHARRSVPPICGEHMQDLAGSAQGNWFQPTEPGGDPSTAIDETDDFAFVHDYVDPGMPAISLSSRGPLVHDPAVGTIADVVTYPVDPSAGGQINRDPSGMAPGTLYCFDTLSWRFGPLPGLFLMALPDATTIRVFYFEPVSDCTALLAVLPPDFELIGPGVVEYQR